MPFEQPHAAPAAPPPGASRVEGRTGRSVEIDRPLKLPKSADFYLMHHPNGWRLEETDRGFELLPVLKDLSLVPGINRVELSKAGPRSENARTRLRDQGWVVLDLQQDEYRVIIEVQGGDAHCLVWDVIHRYPDGTYDVAFDHVGFADYRRGLVERGLIPPPRPRVVQKLRRRLERRLGRRMQHLHIPGVQVEQDKDQEELDSIDGAVQTVLEVAGVSDPPAPKRRKRRKSAPKPAPPNPEASEPAAPPEPPSPKEAS